MSGSPHRRPGVAGRDRNDGRGRGRAIEDPYLRARADDLRSVGAQVLARILGVEASRAPALEAPGILVAADLTPADTAGLDPAVVLGIATARGGPDPPRGGPRPLDGDPRRGGSGRRPLDIEDGTTLALDGRPRTGATSTRRRTPHRASKPKRRTAPPWRPTPHAPRRTPEPAITTDGDDDRGLSQRRHTRRGRGRGRRRRRRHRVVPHRVPVHGSGRHAHRGRTGSRLPRAPPRHLTADRCCCERSTPARTNRSRTSVSRRNRTRSSGCEVCDWDWHDPTCC